MKATTVRIDENMLVRLDSLAESLSRPRSWVIKQAIERFVEYEEWFVQEVQAGLKEVEQGKIATDEEVSKAFDKWGVDAR
jgi:predicted transcriptional regulator